MLCNKNFLGVKSPPTSQKGKYFEIQFRRKDAQNDILNSMQPKKNWVQWPQLGDKGPTP